MGGGDTACRAALRLGSTQSGWVTPHPGKMASARPPQGHRAQAPHKDKQTKAPSWALRPQTHASLGIVQTPPQDAHC